MRIRETCTPQSYEVERPLVGCGHKAALGVVKSSAISGINNFKSTLTMLTKEENKRLQTPINHAPMDVHFPSDLAMS